MKRLFFSFLVCLAVSISGLNPAHGEEGLIRLASTIGPVDAGIVPLLEERFEQESGIRVRHVAAGTGKALQMAEQGNFDLVLVHAKALEEKFISSGFGTERIPLMYNDFVIVGPATDPAGIKGIKSAADALGKIAAHGSTFISRGDNSGTNVAEINLWSRSGIKPSGPWYVAYERGKEGNAQTLRYADLKDAYTFMDRATWLSLRESIKLIVLVEKDEVLLNHISLIPVNPKKFPEVNSEETMKFVNWLTSPENGQKIIANFGREKYGEPLFYPDSMEWKVGQNPQSSR